MVPASARIEQRFYGQGFPLLLNSDSVPDQVSECIKCKRNSGTKKKFYFIHSDEDNYISGIFRCLTLQCDRTL